LQSGNGSWNSPGNNPTSGNNDRHNTAAVDAAGRERAINKQPLAEEPTVLAKIKSHDRESADMQTRSRTRTTENAKPVQLEIVGRNKNEMQPAGFQ
jgi:hypothetical protein